MTVSFASALGDEAGLDDGMTRMGSTLGDEDGLDDGRIMVRSTRLLGQGVQVEFSSQSLPVRHPKWQ